MRQFAFAFALMAVMGMSAGCNTMKGAGQDMENTGKNIQDTVDKNQ